MTDEEKVLKQLEEVLGGLDCAVQRSAVILHRVECAHHNLKLIHQETKERVADYRRQLLKENSDGV